MFWTQFHIHPKGLDCSLGAVLSIAVLGAEEMPAGLLLGTRGFSFSKTNKNTKTGLSFWLESSGLCLLMTPQSANNTHSINLGLEVLFGVFHSCSGGLPAKEFICEEQDSKVLHGLHWDEDNKILLLILDKWRSSRLPLGTDTEGGGYWSCVLH